VTIARKSNGWRATAALGLLAFMQQARGDCAVGELAVAISDPDNPSVSQNYCVPPLPAPALGARARKQYQVSSPVCISMPMNAGAIVAVWHMPPMLQDVATKVGATYPNVDLRVGDILTVAAPLCTAMGDGPVSINYYYQFSNIVPRPNGTPELEFGGRGPVR